MKGYNNMKKNMIGHGDPDTNMELFNQSLDNGSITGSFTESNNISEKVINKTMENYAYDAGDPIVKFTLKSIVKSGNNIIFKFHATYNWDVELFQEEYGVNLIDANIDYTDDSDELLNELRYTIDMDGEAIINTSKKYDSLYDLIHSAKIKFTFNDIKFDDDIIKRLHDEGINISNYISNKDLNKLLSVIKKYETTNDSMKNFIFGFEEDGDYYEGLFDDELVKYLEDIDNIFTNSKNESINKSSFYEGLETDQDIYKQKLEELVKDADAKCGPFGEKDPIVEYEDDNLMVFLESQVSHCKILYNPKTEEWSVIDHCDVGEDEEEVALDATGDGFNNLIYFLFDNSMWFYNIEDPSKYYVDEEDDSYQDDSYQDDDVTNLLDLL